MTNPGNGRNDVNVNPRNSGFSSKHVVNDVIDVIDSFNHILSTADPGALVGKEWSPRNQGRDTRKTRGSARVHQSEIDNDNFSSDGRIKGPTRSQRGIHEDANSRGKSQRNDNLRETSWDSIKRTNNNDGRIYTANNTRNRDIPDDYHMVNGVYQVYHDSNTSTNVSRLDSTDNYTNNNHASNTHDNNPSDKNNVINRTDEGHWNYLAPSAVPQRNISPSRDLDDEEDDIATKINAWHKLVDPNAKERPDGVGTGQLHRKGRNYKPVDEKTVLEIQHKGKTIKKKRSRESFVDKSYPVSTKLGSFSTGACPESLNRDNPSPKHGASLLNHTHSEPTAVRKPPVQQRRSPPSPLPPSSSPKPFSQAQPPQPNAPEKDRPDVQFRAVNTSFLGSSQNSPQKSQTATRSPQSSPYYRQKSPVRSPELPYIPPEFDSTPYRKQPSPLTVEHKRDHNGNDYEDQEDHDQSSDALTEYYDDSENESTLYGDRGKLVLTINVELQEGENRQAIYVYKGDDPLDLAREFCHKWEVTNEDVEPALAQLIKEEKEKRMVENGVGKYTELRD